MDAEDMNDNNGKTPFPFKLFRMLEDAHGPRGFSHIVGWHNNGTVFKVHDASAFMKCVAPKYFKQTRYKSFQRQLCLYGFDRVMDGPLKGSRFHRSFVRGKYEFVEKICYIGIKSRVHPQRHPRMDDRNVAFVEEVSIVDDHNMHMGSSTVAACPHTSSLHCVEHNDELCPATPTTTHLPQQQGVISPSISTAKNSYNFSSRDELGNVGNMIGEKGQQDPIGFLFEGIDIDLVLDPILDKKNNHSVHKERLDDPRVTLIPKPVFYHDSDMERANDYVMAEAWRMGYEHALSLL